MIQGRNWFPE